MTEDQKKRVVLENMDDDEAQGIIELLEGHVRREAIHRE